MAKIAKAKPTAKAPKLERVERLDRVLMFPNTWDFPFMEDLTGANPMKRGANEADREYIVKSITDYLQKKYGFREVKSEVISDRKTLVNKTANCTAFFFVDTVQDGYLSLYGSALTTTGGKQEIEPEKGLLVLTAGVKSYKLYYTPSAFRTVIVFSYKKPLPKK